MICTKEAHQSAKFQTLDCSGEIVSNLYFDRLLLLKVYKVSTKKSMEKFCLMIPKSGAKFKEKLTCGLENDLRNLANFHQNTWKCQNWYFHGILFVQSRKCMSYKFTEELLVMTLKNNKNSEEESTCRFKTDITNLTNFDSRTWKFQKFTLEWAGFDQSI